MERRPGPDGPGRRFFAAAMPSNYFAAFKAYFRNPL